VQINAKYVKAAVLFARDKQTNDKNETTW